MPFACTVLSTASLASNMAGIGFLGIPFCARVERRVPASMTALEPVSKRRSHTLIAEPLRHMWSTLGGVGGAIAL